MTRLRRAGWLLAWLLLALLAATLTWGAFRDWASATTSWQRISSAFQLASGLATAAVAVGLAMRAPKLGVLGFAWGAVVAVTGGLASFGWGETSAAIAFISGVVTALFLAPLCWLMVRASRTWRQIERN